MSSVYPGLLGLSGAQPMQPGPGSLSVAQPVMPLLGPGSVNVVPPSGDAIDRPAEVSCRTLFVRNLPYKATDEDIRGLFGPYGEIKSLFSIISTRGLAFITFMSCELSPAESRARTTLFELPALYQYKARVAYLIALMEYDMPR
eukprot:jgi/Hompol1/1156/HPOL_001332-RA